jgi:hypothetical protein
MEAVAKKETAGMVFGKKENSIQPGYIPPPLILFRKTLIFLP